MKIIGSSQPIHDALGKVTGHLRYANDLPVHGLLHMAILFSPIPHGIVKSIDAQDALDMEGVVDVLHGFNTTEKKYNRYRSQAIQKIPEHEQLFNRHLRFVGDRVAAVVAESEEIARAAVRKIRVEYEEYPFSLSTQETLEGKIDNVFEEGPVFGVIDVEVGEKELPEDVVRVQTESHLSRITHACMETHCALADYDRYSGELTIWSPNQSVHGIRTVVGDLFELHYSKIRVIKTTMGGSFGAKQEWILEPLVAAAALRLGRPVKLNYNRKETIVSTVSRSPMDATVQTCFSKDGKLLSVEIDNVLDAGAYLGNSFDYVGAIGSKFFRCYNYPHMRYQGKAVITNSPVSGAYRGWTAPEMAIMIEHNMNEAAKRLNMDPVALRLLNVALPGQTDRRLQETLGEIKVKECLELGQKEFEWDKKKEEVRQFNLVNHRWKQGIGVSCGGHVNGYFPRMGDFCASELRLAEDGSILANLSLHDHGCGTITAMKMIIAEVLHLDMDKIHVREADTHQTPLDFGCYASRTVYVLGQSLQRCAESLVESICEDIATMHQLSRDDVSFIEGVFYFRAEGEDREMSFREAAHAIMRNLKKEVVIVDQLVSASNPGVTGAHYAHVQVDTYTGMTKILEYVAVHDIGRVINYEICVAQTQGAILMGGGAALTEQMITGNTGRTTNSFKDYHLLNAFDAPNTKVLFVEGGGDDGPFGAKSIGEICHVPVCPVLVAAVNDALGTDQCVIPFTPDRIVRIMAEKREQEGRA